MFEKRPLTTELAVGSGWELLAALGPPGYPDALEPELADPLRLAAGRPPPFGAEPTDCLPEGSAGVANPSESLRA